MGFTKLTTPATTAVKPQAPATAAKAVKVKAADGKAAPLSEILAGIRKDKGEQVVIPASAIRPVRRLPTGIFELDFAIGGGFPCGRYSIVYGPESSNKSNIGLKAVVQAQKLTNGKNLAVWVDLEQQFDPIWAAKMGVDVDKLLVVKPSYGEEAADIIDAIVRADDLGILVVDSLAALIANREVQKSLEEFDVGTSAMLIKRLANKLMIAFGEQQKKGNDPCIVFINQRRFKPGVIMGDPETMPGGEAIKFLAALRFRTYGKDAVDKATNQVQFKETSAVIKKAKVPVRSATFSFEMCVGNHDFLKIGETDSFTVVKGHLQSFGLLEKKGQEWQLNAKKKMTFKTIGSVQDLYYSDQKFQVMLQQLVIEEFKTPNIIVEEADYSPKDVPPGVVQSIAPLTNG